ncbi:hypothetical protein F4813DRAFT_341956 [Daldinia decipiens]|uniref:uncharacterized protein n=1 Tax=Daldinia decipiens TaxID=326647 RepID=UPI0020C31549|nr:uncharacterized protein F4813DRAFT_341956 [Daldinia decipiens]KAI1662788.1 hypothetical protein F4813DRAFT_341956 [Daldinia decipiens]
MDPLSITAGAAGFISLGITAAGGIIQYCKSLRSQDVDFVQLTRHAKELESFLGSIKDRNTASQSPNTDIHNSLQRCCQAYDACLNDFKQLNAKYTNQKSNRKLIYKLKYPFDKAKLNDLRSQLQEFHVILLGILQLLNLDATREIRSIAISESAKTTLAVQSIERQVQSSLSDVKQAVTDIHTGIGQLEASFQRDLGEAKIHIITYLGDNKNVVSNQASLIIANQETQSVSLKQYIDQRLGALENNQQEFFTRALAVSAGADGQATLLNLNTDNGCWVRNNVREKMNLRMPVRNIFDSLCTCPVTQQHHSTKRHQAHCIYSPGNREERTFTRKFRVFRRMITASCKVEYARMNWARDWHVYPNLTVRMTVPVDSPSFLVIHKARVNLRNIKSIRELEELFKDTLISLKKIFTNGEGWPTDVDEYGWNLLHEVVLAIFLYSDYMGSDEAAVVFMQFVVALNEIGVPIDDCSGLGTPLGYLLNGMRLSWNRLVDNSTFVALVAKNFLKTLELLETTPAPLPNLDHSTAMTIINLRDPEFYELLEYNDLIYLIFHRCEHDIRRLLMSDPSLMHFRTPEGQTPLHFAVNWPRGLSLLIKYGGESIQSIINGGDEDLDPAPPLNYALYIKEVDSIKLLLDAGASIPPNSFLLFTAEIDTNERAKQIMHLVVESLAKQRKDLLRLALQYLPSEKIQELELRSNEILDDKAFVVAEALRQQHVPMPTAYDFLTPGSVYHWAGLTYRIAQKLFEAGFCKTDGKLHGCTPLNTLTRYSLTAKNKEPESRLKLIAWFKDHGTNLHAPAHVPNDIFRLEGIMECDTAFYINIPRPLLTIHYLMHVLGCLTWDQILLYGLNLNGRLLQQTYTPNQPILSSLFGDDTSDSCSCFCTADGCTPTSKYLTTVLRLHFNPTIYDIHDNNSRSECMAVAIRTTEIATPDSNKYKVSVEYIRLITFAALGMRHTCCRFKEQWERDPLVDNDLVHLLDIAEIKEIREEDRYLAEQLEVLMDEFEKKFQELNVPLSQFVEQYLLPRLREIREERDEMSAEDLRAIRETGVILDEF